MKRLMLAAGLIGAVATTPAAALTYVKTAGNTPGAYAAPTLSVVNRVQNFNSGFDIAGFTTTGAGVSLQSSTNPGQYQQPAFNDGSQYLVVFGQGNYTIRSTGMGYNSVSFFIGSIDAVNTVDILDLAGNVIQSYSGTTLALPETASGSATSAQQNARFTLTNADNSPLIGGVRFTSANNSIEVDNLVFGAVPEPTTWALMLAGFGMVGLAMRSRRRRTNVVFG